MGEIMACEAINKKDTGTTRLFRILVSESAHLIWRLRNERVIQEKDAASDREIRNRWLKAINNRITLDCLLVMRQGISRVGALTKQGEKLCFGNFELSVASELVEQVMCHTPVKLNVIVQYRFCVSPTAGFWASCPCRRHRS
ncbi:hypothetical protein B0H10DRAFT_2336653 [Mycena sp. CBHHK59/15]|nr:hypothetical protein B0H10DRAFT_2336653 [Mycena sp. CBHHK59/15]